MSKLEPHKSGYTKRPKAGQFRKGQSGNPKGGPKTIDDPARILIRVLKRKVTVSGTGRKMTMHKALTMKFRELVLCGDRRAVKLAAVILREARLSLPPTGGVETQMSQHEIRVQMFAKLGLEFPEHLLPDYPYDE